MASGSTPDYKSLPRMTADLWLAEQGRQKVVAKRGGKLGDLLGMIRAQRSTAGYFNEITYSGAPSGASAELGEQFLDVLGEKAASGVTELLDGTIGPEDCHSPIWGLRFIFLNPLMIRLSNWLIGMKIPIA